MISKKCSFCKQTKPIKEFKPNSEMKDKFHCYCTACTNYKSRETYQRKKLRPHPPKPTHKICYICDKEKPVSRFTSNISNADRVSNHCKDCVNYYCKNRYKERSKNPEYLSYINSKTRKRYTKLRKEVIAAYGSKCACCKESVPEFLAIDHINGDGAKQRKNKSIGRGHGFYRWLKQNGFPKDNYRLLCHNCNSSFGYYGYCPHQS